MIGSLLLAVGLCAGPRAPTPALVQAPEPAATDSVRFGRFGPVALYGDARSASHVVLFVSGDGGWNLGVVEMAKHLAAMDALVVGIDIRRYLAALDASSDPCSYPAADFEALSQYVQKTLGRPRYSTPVLVGYSSGATLVYASLVQAPPNTFRGAISLGFHSSLRPGDSGSRAGLAPQGGAWVRRRSAVGGAIPRCLRQALGDREGARSWWRRRGGPSPRRGARTSSGFGRCA
jgi:type IV secretory pathway VirJ component